MATLIFLGSLCGLTHSLYHPQWFNIAQLISTKWRLVKRFWHKDLAGLMYPVRFSPRDDKTSNGMVIFGLCELALHTTRFQPWLGLNSWPLDLTEMLYTLQPSVTSVSMLTHTYPHKPLAKSKSGHLQSQWSQPTLRVWPNVWSGDLWVERVWCRI